MTSLGLLLLLLVAVVPLLDRPLGRFLDDPVTLVAATAVTLLGAAAALGQAQREGYGQRIGELTDWVAAGAAPLAVVASVLAGSHVVRAVFRLTRGDLLPRRRSGRRRPTATARSQPADELILDAPGSVLRGGAWIGYLERAAVAAAILSGFPEGLALVLAVKGVGRYPELREAGRDGGHRADAPEEFIIGTIASVLWAAACAGTATLLGA